MSSETLNPNLENSPNSTPEFEFWFFFNSLFCRKKWIWRFLQTQALEFGEFSKLHFLVFEKKNMWILFLLNLSSGKSPNSTSECVYFLNFDFFLRVWRFWTCGEKNMRAEVFLVTKYACRRCFLYQKKPSHAYFFWVWRFSPNSENLQTHFFRVWRGWVLQTQGLSLENSPNSDSKETKSRKHVFFHKPKWVWRFLQTQEFGEFSKLRFKWFLSLENSPNSRVEFGEFCKLKCWVWRILQTQNQKKKLSDFFLKMHLENSQEFHLTKKKTEFGEFSKLRCKISKLMFFSKSSNSSAEFGEFSKLRFKRKKSEFGEFFKLRFKISKLICSWKKWTGEKKQTQRLRGSQDLQCPGPNLFSSENHGHEKKTQRLRLSPVWVQKVVRVSREQNFATRKQLYSWESSREGEFSNLCCQNLQAYMWPARLYCCCFCKRKKTIKTVKTPQSLCLENTLNSSNSNKFVSLKTTMLTTKLHTYLCSKSPYCVVVSKYVFGSGSGSVVFKFLCSKNSPTEKNQLRKYFRITSHK